MDLIQEEIFLSLIKDCTQFQRNILYFARAESAQRYDAHVERMANLAMRFAIVKALLEMALTARTHLVASIELTFSDTVSV